MQKVGPFSAWFASRQTEPNHGILQLFPRTLVVMNTTVATARSAVEQLKSRVLQFPGCLMQLERELHLLKAFRLTMSYLRWLVERRRL